MADNIKVKIIDNCIIKWNDLNNDGKCNDVDDNKKSTILGQLIFSKEKHTFTGEHSSVFTQQDLYSVKGDVDSYLADETNTASGKSTETDSNGAIKLNDGTQYNSKGFKDWLDKLQTTSSYSLTQNPNYNPNSAASLFGSAVSIFSSEAGIAACSGLSGNFDGMIMGMNIAINNALSLISKGLDIGSAYNVSALNSNTQTTASNNAAFTTDDSSDGDNNNTSTTKVDSTSVQLVERKNGDKTVLDITVDLEYEILPTNKTDKTFELKNKINGLINDYKAAKDKNESKYRLDIIAASIARFKYNLDKIEKERKFDTTKENQGKITITTGLTEFDKPAEGTEKSKTNADIEAYNGKSKDPKRNDLDKFQLACSILQHKNLIALQSGKEPAGKEPDANGDSESSGAGKSGDNKNAQVTALKTDFKKLKTTIKSYEDAIAGYEKKKAIKDTEKKAIKDTIDFIQQEIKKLDKKLDTLEMEHPWATNWSYLKVSLNPSYLSGNNNVKSGYAELDELREEKLELQKKVDELEKKLKNLDQKK